MPQLELLMNIDRRWLAALLSAALGLAACSRDTSDDTKPKAAQDDAAPAADPGPGVNVDEQAQQRLGLAFATVGEAPGEAVAEGIATVLDSAALVSTLDEIAAARSDVDSQDQNVRRLQQLYQDGGNASLQALESARSQLAAARARLTAAQSRARADWGSIIDPADDAARAAMKDLQHGDGALLRAEFSADLKNAAQLRYSATTTGEPVAAHFIGYSKAPTASTSGAAVTLAVPARESRDLALRPGARLSVIAAGTQGASQALIPASAAIADGGALWCYIERTPGRFDRIALDSEHRVAQGYPAPDAKVGARVVVRGAPLLLSLERSAGAPAAAAEED
jgi:hypothetical protein